MLINASGQLFGKYNVIDFVTVALALVIALGVIAVQSGWHRTSGQMIKGESDIAYTVYLRNLKTLNPNLFEAGKKLSITIRNQPRGEVLITEVKRTPKRLSLPANNASGYITIEDPADPYGYDYLITLKDHALITSDGYVTEGIKVKIGLPIEVEGFDYRVSGNVVAINELESGQK